MKKGLSSESSFRTIISKEDGKEGQRSHVANRLRKDAESRHFRVSTAGQG